MESSFIENIYEIFSTDSCAAIFPGYINDLSKRRFRWMVNYAFEKSPYYRRKFQKAIVKHAPYECFPISNKKELMANFDQVVTEPGIRLTDIKKFISTPKNIGKPFKDKYFIWESSGTNGIQGIYIQDRQCVSKYQAIEAMRKPLDSIFTQYMRQRLGNERIAYIGVLDHYYASTVSLAILRNDFPHLQKIIKDFSIFEPTEKLVAQLIDYRPSVIITYPSMANCLAGHGFQNFHPQEFWLGGENLSTQQRNYIEGSLNTKIYSSYGASEFLPIAWECGHNNLHVNSDQVLLEAVDENYLPLPAGITSHTTLLTNFSNTTQPIIRYDLGDTIRYSSTKCSCGSVLPHIEISGRASDILRFTDIQGNVIKIPALLIIGLIEEHGIFNAIIVVIKNSNTEGKLQELHIDFGQNSHPTEQQIQKTQHSIRSYLKQNYMIDTRIVCATNIQKLQDHSGKVKLLRAES